MLGYVLTQEEHTSMFRLPVSAQAYAHQQLLQISLEALESQDTPDALKHIRNIFKILHLKSIHKQLTDHVSTPDRLLPHESNREPEAPVRNKKKWMLWFSKSECTFSSGPSAVRGTVGSGGDILPLAKWRLT
jgi:hypothetical protein